MEKLTEIKSRLLQFAEQQGLRKEEFYRQIGIDGANFRGKNALSELGSEKIVSILSTFPDLNSDWLLLGRGEMLRSATQSVGNISHSTAVGINVNGNDINISYDPLLPVVESLSDSVARMTAQNAQMLAELSRLLNIIEKKLC